MMARLALILICFLIATRARASAADLPMGLLPAGQFPTNTFYLEYSHDLKDWNWFCTLITTNDGERTALTMEEFSTNAPMKAWRAIKVAETNSALTTESALTLALSPRRGKRYAQPWSLRESVCLR